MTLTPCTNLWYKMVLQESTTRPQFNIDVSQIKLHSSDFVNFVRFVSVVKRKNVHKVILSCADVTVYIEEFISAHLHLCCKNQTATSAVVGWYQKDIGRHHQRQSSLQEPGGHHQIKKNNYNKVKLKSIILNLVAPSTLTSQVQQ